MEIISHLFDELVKSRHSGEACAGLDPVTGVQTICNHLKRLDSGFRRNDKKWCFSTFYEVVKFDAFVKSPLQPLSVIPAKAGIQLFQALLDSRFRGSDVVFDFLRVHQNLNIKKSIILAIDQGQLSLAEAQPYP